MNNVQNDKVIFRKFPEGDVIALFPEQNEGRGTINSYTVSYTI